MLDISQPSRVMGVRRALFELGVGLSAARAMHETQEALVAHMCRALAMRLVLELPNETLASGVVFAAGGVAS